MAIIQLLRKEDLTPANGVNFTQNIEETQILPHIMRVLKFQLLNELQSDLHADILALEGKDDAEDAAEPLTQQQKDLYEYYQKYIKPYCIVQAWFNHLEVGEIHVTPAGPRTFNEPQSSSLTDRIFAGMISNAKGLLQDARRAMLNRLEADSWTIGEKTYPRDAEHAQNQAVSSIGFSVILPHHRHKKPVPPVYINEVTVLEINP